MGARGELVEFKKTNNNKIPQNPQNTPKIPFHRCQEAGEYLVSIKFNDQHIPESPFIAHVTGGSQTDARKLFIRDLQEHGLQVGIGLGFGFFGFFFLDFWDFFWI